MIRAGSPVEHVYIDSGKYKQDISFTQVHMKPPSFRETFDIQGQVARLKCDRITDSNNPFQASEVKNECGPPHPVPNLREGSILQEKNMPQSQQFE